MSAKEEPKPKVNKPGNYPFRQQTLPAWKPILTPRTVLPTFAVFGIIFLAIGIALFVAANGVVEQQWDYTQCKSTTNSSLACADLLDDRSLGYTNTSNLGQRCRCEIPVSLTSSFDTQSTSLFYGLTNFYQNHRRYVSSRWDPQLSGDVIAGDSSTCDPLYKAPNGLPYTPCGLIANSLFNDTIQLFRCDDPTCANRTRVPLSGSGISWPSDRKVKFRNPTTPGQLCSYPGWLNTSAARPPSWPVDVCVLGFNVSTYNPGSPLFGSAGYGYENEDFIVWMRTAALPDFRKLYRYVQAPLYDGKYVFAIDYNYPVTSFEGTKSIILSTSSWIGGHNIFLGTCYIVVACVSIAVVVFFAVLQHYKPRHISDDKFLRWEREQ